MVNGQEMDLKQMSPAKKIFKAFENIVFIIFMAIMVTLIFITAQSRITGKEPALLGHRVYIVESGSMSPTLPVDSMIIVKELAKKDVRVGDIITYYGNDQNVRVTHRVVEVLEGSKSFITRGDANNTNDPMPLMGDRIIGKVVFKISHMGKVFRALGTKLGIAIIISMIVVKVIFPTKKNVEQ